MSMYRVFTCVVGRGCLLWPVHFFLAKLYESLPCFILYSKAKIWPWKFWPWNTEWRGRTVRGSKRENISASGERISSVAQSCPTLCDPMDCSPPGSSLHGILQARILEWVAMRTSRDLPNPGIEPTSLMSPALTGGFFTTSITWEAPKIPLEVNIFSYKWHGF